MWPSENDSVEEVCLSWYKSHPQEVSSDSEIVSHSVGHYTWVSNQTQCRNFNLVNMAYQIPVKTHIFEGDGDPQKYWFVREVNLIDVEKQQIA